MEVYYETHLNYKVRKGMNISEKIIPIRLVKQPLFV